MTTAHLPVVVPAAAAAEDVPKRRLLWVLVGATVTFAVGLLVVALLAWFSSAHYQHQAAAAHAEADDLRAQVAVLREEVTTEVPTEADSALGAALVSLLDHSPPRSTGTR